MEVTMGSKLRDEQPPRKGLKGKNFAKFLAFLASLNSILLGYDIGVMSGAKIFIQRTLPVSDVQFEILAGCIQLFSLVGSALAGRTADWIGRRATIVLAGGIFFFGSLILGFANGYAMLMVGRFVAGVGVGYAMVIAPLYTTEVSPASSRGFLTSLPEIFINVGILLGYVSNVCFSKLPAHLAWRFMLGVAAIPSVFLASAVLLMPESPRWLVMKGRVGDAKEVLERTSESVKEAGIRLDDIKEAAGIPLDCDHNIRNFVLKKEDGSKDKGVWRELLISPTAAVRHVFIAAMAINFFQQVSGIDAVVLYSPSIFEKAGLKSDHDKLLATVAVGGFKTLSILVATIFLDKFGRRPFLLTSVGGMVISVFTLATSMTVIERSGGKTVTWAVGTSFAMLLAYVSSFSIGIGPIVWVYMSEIYPLRFRAVGMAMGVALNRLMSGIIGMTFLSLSKAMTTGGAFFMFGAITTVAWVFFYTFLPETKGLQLENTLDQFGGYFRLDYGSKREVNKPTNKSTPPTTTQP